MSLNKNNVNVSDDETAGLYLLEQTMGYTYQAALRAVTILGVADHLVDGPKTANELAKILNVQGQRLHRALRALAMRGVFRELSGGLFELTRPAKFLCTNSKYSLRDAVLMLTDETCWRPLGEIVESIRGNYVFKHIFGVPFFEYHTQENAPTNCFHGGMSSMSKFENQFIVRNYTFPERVTVVDIAGGFGGLLLNVLQNNPTLHGILFDQPHVLARHRLGELRDDTRWELISGSFFESCPRGDIYLLKYIMHGWPDDQASCILRNCRESMAPGARILVMDPLISEDNCPDVGKSMDLLCMGIYDGGGDRTEEEFRQLFASADLQLHRVINTGSYISIIEAIAN